MDSTTNTATLVGGVIALSIALTKIIEGLIAKITGKKGSLSSEERGWLKTLFDIHSVKDSNGVPRVYSPHDWSDIQRDLVSSLGKITITQEKTAWVLESIGKQLERISDKIDKQID